MQILADVWALHLLAVHLLTLHLLTLHLLALHLLIFELLLHVLVILLLMVLRMHIVGLGRLLDTVRGGEVGHEIAVNAFLGASFTRLRLLTLQMQARARLAGLRDSAMLDDGRLRLRIIFGVAESVSLQQIGTCKRLGAYLTLIRFLLGVHPHVSAEVVEPGIAFGASSTAI